MTSQKIEKNDLQLIAEILKNYSQTFPGIEIRCAELAWLFNDGLYAMVALPDVPVRDKPKEKV